MSARELFEQGNVRAAQAQLSERLRSHPEDVAARTFLFELLCFSGDWSRAERQLTVLSEGNREREIGALLYRSALFAERMRHEIPSAGLVESASAATFSGTLNGKPFRNIRDIEPEIGSSLEVFVAGSFIWLPFAQLRSVHVAAPRRLRDLLWLPATVQTRKPLPAGEMKHVLLPAIYSFTWKLADESAWLGRKTCLVDRDGRERAAGQKMLLVDDEEVSLLDVRELHFDDAEDVPHD